MRWTLLLASTLLGCAAVQPVEQGAVYRATSLTGPQLEETIREHQIRTVVNLAGCQPHRVWYHECYDASQRAGVGQLDLTIDPRGPDRAELIELLEVYRAAPRPLLLVGRYPGDDVGFAAGFYRLAVAGANSDAARRELPFWQSHRWPIERLSALDRVLVEWRGEADFHRNYQIAEANPNPLVSSAGFSDRAVREEPSSWRHVRKNAETVAADALGSTASAYAVRAHRKIEVGTVLRDYSAVIIDGPVSKGPIVAGRTHSPAVTENRRRPTAGPKRAHLGVPESSRQRAEGSRQRAE
jgi:hypothetical protein